MPDFIGKTDPGRVRPINEDCFGITEIGSSARLFVVCDGIGGSAAGEQASALALSSFTDFIRSHLAHLSPAEWRSLSLAQIKRTMRAAAVEASRRVHTAALRDPALTGMGSTLVAVLVTLSDRRAYVLNVGDSRLYTVSRTGIEKITRDHSYIQYLLDVGRITPDQVKELHIQNYITQAIGAYDHVDGDFCALDLTQYASPTYLLLCSDGLYSTVSESQMTAILTNEDTLSDKADRLIAAAKENGGTDNITVIITEV